MESSMDLVNSICKFHFQRFQKPLVGIIASIQPLESLWLRWIWHVFVKHEEKNNSKKVKIFRQIFEISNKCGYILYYLIQIHNISCLNIQNQRSYCETQKNIFFSFLTNNNYVHNSIDKVFTNIDFWI